MARSILLTADPWDRVLAGIDTAMQSPAVGLRRELVSVTFYHDGKPSLIYQSCILELF